jgi:hypothetical protein
MGKRDGRRAGAFGGRRWQMIVAIGLGIMLAAALAAAALAAKPTVITAGNLVVKLNGGVAPKALPKRKLSPVTLKLSAELSTKDGSHPPAANTFEAEFDKNGTLNAKGLPVCKQGQLEAQQSNAALKACKSALIGRGFAEAEVQFPESNPFNAKGPLLVFNGGTKGNTTLILVHVYANVPAPTAFITPVKVTKIHKGKYGNKVLAQIPTIAGGSGSTIKFGVTNKKLFTYKHKKQSYFLAKCPSGRFYARGSVGFSDGTRLKGTVIRPCTPKG